MKFIPRNSIITAQNIFNMTLDDNILVPNQGTQIISKPVYPIVNEIDKTKRFRRDGYDEDEYEIVCKHSNTGKAIEID